jgi:hypothetical protein
LVLHARGTWLLCFLLRLEHTPPECFLFEKP